MKPSNALSRLKQLHDLTPARVGLARAGSSISTLEVLKFDRDHARARDAVHLPFDSATIEEALRVRELPVVQVHSAAADRSVYLQRPDLGRQLDEDSRRSLEHFRLPGFQEFDLGVVIADGLSARAVHTNAIALVDQFRLLQGVQGWRWSPVVVASQARVAIADEIGEILNTRISIILIGERPGLSAADSMGIYVTFAPRKGRTDAERNCISNIRPGGLGYKDAALKLESLIREASRRRLSGVLLKDLTAGHRKS
ncbi:MAG: ethanolamine ammonia-lyase subunit EutC [Desulfosarcinaceae bacterium]|jgi:ethanolamine ammonia-lyase small subunit